MGLIFRLASRNIFRNTRRTLLTIALIACGLAALLFTDSFVRGMLHTMVNISTQTYLGHGQMHAQDYRKNQDVDDYINNPTEILTALSHYPTIFAATGRVQSGGMVSSSQNVASANVIGVEAQQEAKVSLLKAAMVAGDYLSGGEQEIILGYELANILEVQLGDRLVVTLSQANGGELSQALFRVSGLFRFNDRSMDKSLAFINLSSAQLLLNIQGVHEIAFRFHDVQQADDASLPIWQQFTAQNIETLNWRQLVPALNSMLEMSNYSTLIAAVILFCLVTLGSVNTTFMSIYERQQEFGVLLALGTRPMEIFKQILMESTIIALLSMLAGLIVGGLISAWFQVHGVDYGSLEMSGLTLNEPIYLMLNAQAFMEISLSILVVTVLASIYPALHAARLQPAFAMRKNF